MFIRAPWVCAEQAVIVDLPDGALFALLRLPGDADATGLTSDQKALVPRNPQDLSAETGIKQVRTISNAPPNIARAICRAKRPATTAPSRTGRCWCASVTSMIPKVSNWSIPSSPGDAGSWHCDQACLG
jgi:hypothetical protein